METRCGDLCEGVYCEIIPVCSVEKSGAENSVPDFSIEQIAHKKSYVERGITMAKRVRYAVLTLANGETRMIQVKTTTAEYIRRVIADMILPAKVMGWEVIA